MRSKSYEVQRYEFVSKCVGAGMANDDAEAIARDANTCDLWAVRECNGEVEEVVDEGRAWPAGTWLQPYNINGPGPIRYLEIRPTGPQAEKRIRARVEAMGAGWAVRFNGDPRGSVVCVTIPGTHGNCGDGDWTYVPTRSH